MIVNSTPYSGYAYNVRIVNTTGQLNNYNAYNANGGVLDC